MADMASGDAIRRKWLQLALACALVLGVAVSVRNYLKPASHTVYPVFVQGARHWWQGLSLYEEYPPLDFFRYSPTFALALTPLAPLDDRWGGILWSWLNLLVYLHGLRLLVRDVVPGRWPARLEGVFLALAICGIVRCTWNCQSNALVIGLLLWGSSALVRRRWWVAASLCAAAVLIKLHLVAIVLLLAACNPRVLPWRFLAALAAGAALPFLTQPPELVGRQYQDWWLQLHSLANHRWLGFRDAWTVWELVCPPVQIPAYRGLQLVTAAATLAWCWWQWLRLECGRTRLMLTLGMGLAWLMLFGPATEFATYGLLAPLVAWAVLASWEERRDLPLAVAVYLLTMVIGSGNFNAWFGPLHPLTPTLLPLGSLLFVVWLARRARREAARAGSAALPKVLAKACERQAASVA